METDLYTRLKEAGCDLDHHESDLYVKSTPAAIEVIEAFEAEGGITNRMSFVSEVDGKRWIDLPFAYAPWWNARAAARAKADEAAEEASGPKP